ncbi:cupredoxin domain-containing protein [Longimicrobium sp.]|uniref:cupredoxin domain-containing protein n=1 Tax=Longimicrobium sp. TaxID=2029185 RepID=UPI002E355DF6|nr:cupredoxin domain-containing protein [Longimicrobium sp.]HEX6038662.1 cupredoxin domain-containing protein [Longimicrobium sp.]
MRRASLAALALAAAACGTGASAPTAHRVEIRAFRYLPDTVTAAPGNTVVWTNADVVPHTARAAGAWDTGEIGAAGEGRIVAGAPGTYRYDCAYHPTMHAVLVVR